MILHRLSEAITRQNWSVVIIEILVVVVGIFIGLQVDDWNKTLENRKDEQQFLVQLHEDLLLAEKLSSRVRERRLERLQNLVQVGDVLFGRSERTEISQEECIAIFSNAFFNINVSGLPSYAELVSTGRLAIIQDTGLRRALVELQQTREALAMLIIVQTTAATGTNLGSVYPELIQLESYFDTERGEIRSRPQCDLPEMRKSQAFLNDFSINADRYDAYIMDGLAPWVAQFDAAHQLVDKALGITHELEGR